MAKTSKELGDILHGFCQNVYYQPPEGTKIKHPCIIYERASGLITRADNRSYLFNKSYNVTVIDKDPDSDIPDKVAELPYCTFDRHFVTDNLHHDVFTLYF